MTTKSILFEILKQREKRCDLCKKKKDSGTIWIANWIIDNSPPYKICRDCFLKGEENE